MPHTLNIDGGSRGNPGPAACGVVLRDGDGKTVHEAGYFLGRTTNNVAEYSGLLRGLEAALAMGVKELSILSDSELMVRQITGDYRVKSPDLKPLYDDARRLLARLGAWKIGHVYREGNGRADELANRAMDAKADVVATDGGKPVAAAKTPPAAPRVNPPPGRWRATFVEGSGPGCPAPCKKGTRFEIGSATPAGLCIHATVPVLSSAITDADDTTDGETVNCLRCGAAVRVERA
ncbi:MAG: ribonuclease HI family protein [Planctomycetes bacterium]|nr:ribonuclease HI family protein [Planctomycetota bacterium]